VLTLEQVYTKLKGRLLFTELDQVPSSMPHMLPAAACGYSAACVATVPPVWLQCHLCG
jgi:hypothetical protein